MKKTKRYNAQGYVTNDDSNSGMKEAYDADQLAENFDDYGSKKGAGAAGTSESTTEEAGGAMLKAMRDKASAPKPKPAMPKAQYEAAKPKSTQTGASVPTIGASGTYGGGLGRRSHPEYPEDASKAMADMKKSSPDMTKMSVSERMKASREKSRSGSGATDTRSVNERFRSALGFAKGGSVSASSRADGIAQRGKTRGKMC